MSSLKNQAIVKVSQDTASNWTSNNPTPLLGEWCIETDTTSMKIGDGSTAWTSLPYRLTLTMIAETSRPAAWVLNAGVAEAWADVDFGAYVPTGVKALLLKYSNAWVGDGAIDACRWSIRENGSIITDVDQLVQIYDGFTNLTAGVTKTIRGEIVVDCDTDGIIEYQTWAAETATGTLSLNIMGYYI